MSKKFIDLPALATPNSGFVLGGSQGGTTYKIDLKTIKELFTNDAGLNLKPAVSGHLVVSGNLSVSGNLLASGSTRLGKNFSDTVTVIGGYKQSGSMFISGDVIVTGGFSASGIVYLGKNASSSINISGETKIGGTSNLYGDLNVIGSGFIKNNLVVSGSGQFGTKGSSSSNHIFYGKTIFNHSGIFNDTLHVSGDISGSNNLTILGNANVSGNLTAIGNVFLGNDSTDTLNVYARQIVNNEANFKAPVGLDGLLGVGGNFYTSGSNILGNNYLDSTAVYGQSTFYQQVRISGGLEVTGSTRFSGQVLGLQPATFATGLSVGGNFVTSGKTVLGSASVSNEIHLRGTGYVGADLYITGNLYVSGSVKIQQGYQGEAVKKGFFDPQIKMGFTASDAGAGIRYESGRNPGNLSTILFPWAKGTAPSLSTRVDWNTGDFRSGDYVFITGYNKGTTDPSFNANLPKAYQGVFRIEEIIPSGFRYFPTGHPISPPSYSSDIRPTILAHWRTGEWLRGISGIIPRQGSAHLDIGGGTNNGWNQVHHRIIFDKPFSNPNYIVSLTCNQGSGMINDTKVAIPKSVNVSYMDQNSNAEKIIFTIGAYESSTIVDDDLGSLNEGDASERMPTRVWMRFEEL